MKTVLIIGAGRFGRHLATDLCNMGNEVMLVDRNENLIEEYSHLVPPPPPKSATTRLKAISRHSALKIMIIFLSASASFRTALLLSIILRNSVRNI